MRHVVIFAAPAAGLVVLAVIVVLLAARSARRRAALARAARPQPSSVVHLLTDERELREAIARASRFEREVAELVEHRAARYESLLSRPAPDLRPAPELVPAPELRMPADRGPGTDADPPAARTQLA